MPHFDREVKKRGVLILKIDASYKVSKHLCQWHGKRQFHALITGTTPRSTNLSHPTKGTRSMSLTWWRGCLWVMWRGPSRTHKAVAVGGGRTRERGRSVRAAIVCGRGGQGRPNAKAGQGMSYALRGGALRPLRPVTSNKEANSQVTKK